MTAAIEFSLNGRACRVDVPAHWTVIDLLRDRLDLLGTKGGCGEGVCGTCTVLVDGEPARACLMLAAHLRGRALVTVEGLERDGRLDPLQDAFARHGAAQCGYCTPGMLLSARAFLDRAAAAPVDGAPPVAAARSSADAAAGGGTRARRAIDAAAVREALSGNLCRCTGYQKIVDAVLAAASARG